MMYQLEPASRRSVKTQAAILGHLTAPSPDGADMLLGADVKDDSYNK